MIIIDSNFTNIRQALENMDVVGLSRDLYMVVLICSSPAEVCISGIENIVYESSLLLVILHNLHIIENMTS